MDTECTPGEWRAEYRFGRDSHDRSEWGFAEVCAGDDAILRADRGTNEDIANVHMAAASKDLYESLEAFMSLDRTFRDTPMHQLEAIINRRDESERMARTVFHARKALAKARGENTDEAQEVRREAG